jgi:hypothetical protein
MDMFLVVIALGAVMGGLPGPSQGTERADSVVIGTWEGESKCTVRGSPCHDEHVIYEIAPDEKESMEKVDAYKVVNGEKQFMGTLECRYHADSRNLSCVGGNPQRKADWEYFVSGDTMQGTLVIGAEKALYRKVSVKRKSAKS